MQTVPSQGPLLLLWGVPELREPAVQPFTAERRFQLLILLALAEGAWVERDRAAALLWPDTEMVDARRNLRKVLFKARALAGEAALETTPHAMRWAVASDLAALRAGTLPPRRGPPLQGLDDARNSAWAAWLAGERARLDQLWLDTAHRQLQAAGSADEQAERARQVLAVEPLDETAVAALLRAEQARGQHAQAQAEYRRYAQALAQELGVEPSHALRDLLGGTAEPAAAAASGAAADPPRFVGRRLELQALERLLADPACRLVTVLGPGGVGKSSLARQALARCDAWFPGGCHGVPLQDLRGTEELAARCATVLGRPLPGGDDPLPALLRQLPPTRTLLALDNAEHLLPALPPLLQRALQAAPGLVLLVTSRARLGGTDEHLLPLAGLAVPGDDSRDLEAASTFDAVRLFEQRARAAQRSFTLAPHLAAVLEITQALGGLPLALELAASWVRLLPPAQIAADLRGGLDLLEHDPSGGAPLQRPEHASLRGVLQASWQMLGPRERALLAALSVFEGGFTRAAAQAVAAASMPLLSALVDGSLLAVDDTGRFALHPVVQAFAAERLAQDLAAAAALRDQHAVHFSRQAAALAPQAHGNQRLLVQEVEADHANLRAAWRHALATRQPALLMEMAVTWRVYFETSGRLAEGLQEFRPVLALPDDTPDARRLLARARQAASALLYRRGEPGEARALAEAGAAAAEQGGDAPTLIGCLNNLGLALWHLGESGQAVAPLARALALAEAGGDRQGVATSLGNLAIAYKALGRFDEALAANLRTLAIARELGNQRSVSVRLNNIGNLHRALGQWEQARPYFAEGVRHGREFGLAASLHYLELNLALVDIELGAHDEAQRRLQALLDGQGALGQLVVEVAAGLGLARIDIAQGRLQEARRRLQHVLQRSRSRGTDPHAAQVVLIHAEWLLAQGRRDEAVACWRLLATHALMEEADRLVARRHLQRLGAAETPAPGESLPTLAHWFAQVESPDG